ncbi:IMS import disulfide relay-system CHCH-CHCH-like Cx9C domain-containing protein [Plasmodiophora brassicae]|uniref:IMS import disulfide relay-system CHCH-CHCH-like Cx9C domain-containing protein n=1 Tax=Plasmodiophora brassicae TaxID=37360 RepID=A0A0G4IS46_PLABS|nr:hypothetical protein PBRA_006184 [Plasmodiophora brassicae]SPQ96110.1 unnamed protein product [Plasmodiophora brassicae]
MGKQPGRHVLVTRQAVRRLRGRETAPKPCTSEMISFLNCITANNYENTRCKEEINLLSECTMDAERAKKNSRQDSLMYRLMRLAKQV